MTESPAQRSGTEYQAPSTRTSALRLTETGCSRRASNATSGRGRSAGSSLAKRSHTRCGARRSTSRCICSESSCIESPRGIGVSTCSRTPLPRDSTPPLSCPSPGRAKQGSTP